MVYEFIRPLNAKIDFSFLAVRSYYVVSILIIVFAILAFLWSFERRKPRTREIVLLAVMTALAVVGRLAFFMTPQIKPCAAIIIIAGIMLGRQSGFLCGALTAFVSDFFFGQGPWTPWQMISFGLIGLLSAIVFSGKRGELAFSKVFISIYGFLMTFILYGFIMDTATVFMYTDEPSIFAFLATYVSGLFFNFVHGLSTAVFLFLFAGPFLKKIQRLKNKFQMFQTFPSK